MENKNGGIVKTFRLDIETSNKIDLLKKANNTTMRQIMTDALNEYFKVHLDDAQEAINTVYKAKQHTDLSEHMYIPIDYYALYNDTNKAEINRMISKNELQSVVLGDITLIMVDISESAYKRAELLIMRSNMIKIKKEMQIIRRELNKIKKTQDSEIEGDTSQ
ncbi:hypothetical protein [Sulfurimonas sp.]|uniref:hypothetical protein n=1 Tax=Sulfurimonas sp. TaxID=2022749 RepID=UPI0025EA6345|nr:hypothetical protein [Sulfurimonas sp.]MBW6487461.1 hypothetical protein [Sulfurimonas sp.]